MKLGTKIACGFASLIVISALLGGLAIYNMKQVEAESVKLAEEYVPEVDLCNNVERFSSGVMLEMRGYGLTQDKVFYDKGMANFKELDSWLDKCSELAKTAKNLVKLGPAVDKNKSDVAEYKSLVAQTVELDKKMAENRQGLDTAATDYMKNCEEYLASQNRKMAEQITAGDTPEKLQDRLIKITGINDIIDICNATRVACFKGQAMREPKLIEEAVGNFDEMEKLFDDLRKITKEADNLKQIDDTKIAAQNYKKNMLEFLVNWEANLKLGDQRARVGDELLRSAKDTAEAGMSGTKDIAKESQVALSMASSVMIGGLITALIIGCALAYFIARSITGPIKRIIESLTMGSEQTASAAGQVSSASQSLAQGASEQAAALEETTSSIEEMSSMVKQNAANANEATNLAASATADADTGTQAMGQMSKAIDDIKKSSDETAKIIKTIDEIAFQTNLLALNAAVEAARAGEAGKGFAVVAEEVRNLAQRSAQAAKDTANMIAESVKNADNGVSINKEVAQTLNKIAEGSRKVNDLVAEIAAASNEQAQGIDQINTAVGQMDQVTQSNAANAEESASAAEELSSQAEELNGMVGQLQAMVGNSSGNGRASNQKLDFRSDKGVSKARQKTTLSHAQTSNQQSGQAEAVIPFESEKELSQF